MILTYFTAISNLILYAFVWEKSKTMDFSVCSIGCSSTTKCVQMMILGDLDLFYGNIKFGPLYFILLYGKKVKSWIFQNLFYSMISKLVDAVS